MFKSRFDVRASFRFPKSLPSADQIGQEGSSIEDVGDEAHLFLGFKTKKHSRGSPTSLGLVEKLVRRDKHDDAFWNDLADVDNDAAQLVELRVISRFSCMTEGIASK